MFSVESVETAAVLCQRLAPRLVHPLTLVKPLITGLAPDPYAPKVMGALDEPEVFGVSDPENVSPARKRTQLPAANEVALTLLSVCHGADDEVPLFESEPLAAT